MLPVASCVSLNTRVQGAMWALTFMKTSLGSLHCPTVSRLSLTSQSQAPPHPQDARVLPLPCQDPPFWAPRLEGGQ